MTKIPVLDTIRAAYRFTFTHLGAIIGLIWLPMILATVIGFFVLQRFFSALADAFASNNFALAGPAILGLISFLLVGLLLFAMMAVPVVQLALGSRKSGALAHFAFGMAEWRLFRASLGVVGFLFALLLILSTALGAALGPRAMSANLIALFLFYAAAIFFGLRFGFLLPGVAVEEAGPVLPRSWILSNGNFWRILAIFLAVAVPLRLLMVAVEVAAEGPGILMPQFMTSTAMVAVQLHAENQSMPITAGILFLIAPLALGLMMGASAHAFQALKNPHP
ncbi:MAG TPA: hypothetical protein VHX99_02665 [Rhizomicrobium sp.]|jgi:hypothetical protein|nr:hypothetical protein [Rhizomicrobium sp.]